MQKVPTFVYIDGFNLYYGSVKDTPYKWLDLKKFVEIILHPTHSIVSIKYFTALVSSPPHDPQKTTRQQVYLRALKSYIPEIEIFYGHFLSNPITAPLVNPSKDQKFAYVIKTEEKGSDVNLAVHLLNDAWLDRYDCAVVVSNDSDLEESMRLVKEQKRKNIGLFVPGFPKSRSISRELKAYADFVRPIRTETLKASQLPDPIPGTTIHKPKTW
jgi:uncharacterized LabA/DUF88 family protein